MGIAAQIQYITGRNNFDCSNSKHVLLALQVTLDIQHSIAHVAVVFMVVKGTRLFCCELPSIADIGCGDVCLFSIVIELDGASLVVLEAP